MFRVVIAGVDQHDGGRDAMALAGRLLGTGGQLILAHIYAGDPYVYRGVSAEYEASERERDMQLLERARGEAGIAAELRWHRASSVWHGLHELCESEHADLLVVGRSRRRGIARALEGDDARGALGGGRCAVAIAPSGYRSEQREVREIGVGYDGSTKSEYAMQVARELASLYGGRVSAFEVIDAPLHMVDKSGADDMMQAARSRIAELGDVEPHAACGRPAEALTLYSRVVDLLVIGLPDRSRPGRPPHGSVGRALARTSRCPLLAVTPLRSGSRGVRDDHSPSRRGRDVPDVSL